MALTMMGIWMAALHVSEVFVSCWLHCIFTLYLCSKAVVYDLSQAFYDCFKPHMNNVVTEVEPKGASSIDNLLPIVLVHGIFGFGEGRLENLSYFGWAEKKDKRVLVPDLGCLTSMYDRARQLFYYLKGGRVDYGEEHSKACGHSQFGRVYKQGKYPEWDEDHPIHLVGHSAGAQVVRVLQQMLADKAFKGYENTSANWVLSLTSISGALNGTTRAYIDGMQLEDWRSVKPISLLQLCRFGVILYDWLDISWLKAYYNYGFDHFNMSWKKIGVPGLVDCLMGKAGPFASGDWVLPDLTIQGSMQINCHLNTFPSTFYFSYVTQCTKKTMGVTLPSSLLGIHPSLVIKVFQMSQWSHPPDVSPPYKGYRDEDWQDNDGALNTITMTYPRLPIEHPNHFIANDTEWQPQPGIWYYKIVEGDHMIFIFNPKRARVQFDLLYESIFERCRKHYIRKTAASQPNQAHL